VSCTFFEQSIFILSFCLCCFGHYCRHLCPAEVTAFNSWLHAADCKYCHSSKHCWNKNNYSRRHINHWRNWSLPKVNELTSNSIKRPDGSRKPSIYFSTDRSLLNFGRSSPEQAKGNPAYWAGQACCSWRRSWIPPSPWLPSYWLDLDRCCLGWGRAEAMRILLYHSVKFARSIIDIYIYIYIYLEQQIQSLQKKIHYNKF